MVEQNVLNRTSSIQPSSQGITEIGNDGEPITPPPQPRTTRKPRQSTATTTAATAVPKRGRPSRAAVAAAAEVEEEEEEEEVPVIVSDRRSLLEVDMGCDLVLYKQDIHLTHHSK